MEISNKNDPDKTFGSIQLANIIQLDESANNIQKSILYNLEKYMIKDLHELNINFHYRLMFTWNKNQHIEQNKIVKNVFIWIYKHVLCEYFIPELWNIIFDYYVEENYDHF